MNDSRNSDHASNNRAQSRVIRQKTLATLLLRQSNGRELVLEEDSRRRAREERGLSQRLCVLRHAVLVAVGVSPTKRNVLHRKQLQKVGHVIERSVHVLPVVVQRALALQLAEAKLVDDVGAVEGGQVFAVEEVRRLARYRITDNTLEGKKRLDRATWKLPSPYSSTPFKNYTGYKLKVE